MIIIHNILLTVMATQGSQRPCKYVEGYPVECYYDGCEYVDVVEKTDIDPANGLFGTETANIQLN